MARIFTTPAGEAAAKAWMHDTMVIGGILSSSQRTSTDIYFTYYNPVPSTEAGKICDELVNRDFTDIDSSIKHMANYRFYPSMKDQVKDKRFSQEEIAKAIVYMAERLGLYWDDTIRTPYEIDEFKKTILGAAVYKYERIISAIKDKTSKTSKSSSKSAASNSATPKATSAASSSSVPGFKQQGPKSGEARDLIGLDGGAGKPGEKVYIDPAIGYALAIRGQKPGVKSDYCAQIRPLDPRGAVGSTNKVFFSASHGYGSGICYFDEMSDAKSFYDKLVKSGIVPSDVTNVEIVKTKIDKNGYFLFGTEFGICAVSASVLNENVNSSTVIDEDIGSGWKKATSEYTTEEFDELHSWMRKD